MASPSTTDVFPGFSRLFHFCNPFFGKPFVASLDTTPERGLALLRAQVDPQPVMVARWAMGAGSPSDVVWTTLGLPVLLNSRAIGVLRRAGLSGWSVQQCKLHDKQGTTLTFGFLQVIGRCGPIQDERSAVLDRIYPGGVFPVRRGLYFEAGTWDGSDVFMPAGDVGWILVTARVKEAFETAGISNVAFVPLDDVEQIPR